MPLPFVHMEAPMWRRGRPRSGPTFGETLIVHAVARLVLHPWITNIQASRVKLGPDGVRVALRAGVNAPRRHRHERVDLAAAGAGYGQEMGPEQMEELIRSAGRTPRQRTTLYGTPPPEQVRRSVNPPAPKGRRADRRPLVRAVLAAR